jgi:tetraacyldisaccharide 4'-kinase
VESGSRWRDALLAHWQQPHPTALSRVLQPLSWLYAVLAASNRALHRRGWLRRERAPRPLLVVGNLVAGGAGKTPTVRSANSRSASVARIRPMYLSLSEIIP